MNLAALEYDHLQAINGPLIFLKGGEKLPAMSMVQIEDKDGGIRMGQVLEVSSSHAVIQVLSHTAGLSLSGTRVRLESDVVTVDVSREMIGRIFNGIGRTIDGKQIVVAEARLPVTGNPINPVSRDKPDEFIETGISAIDCFNTLVRGQKLPVFSEAGLPAADLVISLLNHARIDEYRKFLVIFAALGITRREMNKYMKVLSDEGRQLIAFINLAEDPPIERLLTPRFALTTAEYFAFRLGYHVLVILSDMTSYCSALREVGAAREEVLGRRGYPGYMYTDLSTIYERAGRIKGLPGSITQLPVLTLPEGDITHPVPDLTGYITEGQIVLEHRLHRKGIYPPVDVLPSLSRLMNNGIGSGKTREDHRQLANQLYACYAKGVDVRRLVTIVGEDAISEQDRIYLRFAELFERELLHQGRGRRSISETLDTGWRLLRMFPSDQLTRINREMISRYYSAILEDGRPSPLER
ncbi:MAG: V-type ATP synthase subunit B [Candidatus Wallbacteria bacterium]|nr:V-type ATP synthase subunit B [Candidatus Wallbacteria bacterium]